MTEDLKQDVHTIEEWLKLTSEMGYNIVLAPKKVVKVPMGWKEWILVCISGTFMASGMLLVTYEFFETLHVYMSACK